MGFQQAGFKILLGVDIDEKSLLTFQKNFPNTSTLNLDLSDEEGIKKINDSLGSKKVDVVIAGPPCQGFSLTGPRNFDDKRNKLYLSVIEFVRKNQPKAFLIENVPGIATLYSGKIRQEINKRFQNLGYAVNSDVLCAADYGVPQIRKRFFFVGLKKEYSKYSFPDRTHRPDNYLSCSDAIADLPPLEDEIGTEISSYSTKAISPYQKKMRLGSKSLHNHVATCHTDKVKKVISLVPEGGNYKDLPPGVGESRKFNEAWTRYHSKKPARTIDTGHRNHFHYKYNRVPTVRENARLQSFPDKFVFLGNRTQQYRQVGNAVPPILAENMAKQLLLYLDGELALKHKNEFSLYRFINRSRNGAKQV